MFHQNKPLRHKISQILVWSNVTTGEKQIADNQCRQQAVLVWAVYLKMEKKNGGEIQADAWKINERTFVSVPSVTVVNSVFDMTGVKAWLHEESAGPSMRLKTVQCVACSREEDVTALHVHFSYSELIHPAAAKHCHSFFMWDREQI